MRADELGFRPFDADNHYYEPTDAFTRHVPREMQKRCMQWVTMDGRPRLLVGGKLSRFLPNPTFDPIAKPGCLYDFYRGATDGDVKAAFGDLERLADRPEYQQRDARLAVMDEQGLEGCFMMPTLGVGMEEALQHDIPACVAAFRSLNRWLDEEWGFDTDGRILAAPYMTLADPAEATREIEWVAERGARVVCMRAAPPPSDDGPRSFADPAYERFFATLAEAGIVLAFHSGDSGVAFFSQRWGDGGTHQSFDMTALYVMMADRAIFDAIAVLVAHGVLTKHPGLRVATIESGSTWLQQLFAQLAKVYKTNAHEFSEHPHETLRRQVWVSPHFEDDKRMVADLLGVEHMLMGSDWPHAEGLPHPLDYADELRDDGFKEDEIRLVMRENGLGLVAR